MAPVYEDMSINELTTIPPFIRFRNVILWYTDIDRGQPIEEKCKFIESYLLPIKQALNDSDMVEFHAEISENNRNYFSDHSKLLDYIRNRFLPICISSRGYEFQIRFVSDGNSIKNMIVSILEMDKIRRCSNVTIEMFNGEQNRNEFPVLPVEEISTWLERSADGMENAIQERFLKIYLNGTSQNLQEMVDYLTTVYFKTFKTKANKIYYQSN